MTCPIIAVEQGVAVGFRLGFEESSAALHIDSQSRALLRCAKYRVFPLEC